jgi:hypothetical protein
LAKIVTVSTNINLSLLKALSQGFANTQVYDLMQFGFSLDLDKSNFSPVTSIANHGSAIKFPTEVDNYFAEEIKFNSSHLRFLPLKASIAVL